MSGHVCIRSACHRQCHWLLAQRHLVADGSSAPTLDGVVATAENIPGDGSKVLYVPDAGSWHRGTRQQFVAALSTRSRVRTPYIHGSTTTPPVFVTTWLLLYLPLLRAAEGAVRSSQPCIVHMHAGVCRAGDAHNDSRVRGAWSGRWWLGRSCWSAAPLHAQGAAALDGMPGLRSYRAPHRRR